MKTLRTPDSRFEDLPDYPFAPHYVDLDDLERGRLRMHYVDEGPREAAPVMLLHGEPTWSFLYRKMISGLVARGYRVLAPDLIGFGRSDKPTEPSDYSIVSHVAWIRAWIQAVDICNATFFGQDWGSLIGLTAVLHEESRFTGIAVANAALPDPAHLDRMAKAQQGSSDPEAFSRWQAHAASVNALDVSGVIAGDSGLIGAAGTGPGLSTGERAAYDAPFPDASYQAGALVFPSLIQPEKMFPEGAGLFQAAWRVLEKWEKPFVTAYGKADPVLGWFDGVFQEYVPGAKGQPHRTFPEAGHFIQEYEPAALVDVIDKLARASRD